jgi:CheY-like chemotaxis protein
MGNEEQELTILITEDDDAAALLIKKNLRRTGIKANYLRAINGEEALLIIAGKHEMIKIPPQNQLLILLDIRMPKVDGITVLTQLKKNSTFKHIPIIMMTTSNRPSEVQQCYTLGCNAYLKKEVEYKKFTDKINRLADFIQLIEIPPFREE